MSTDPAQQSNHDQTRHIVQNTLLGASLLITVAQTEPVPELLHHNAPLEHSHITQTEPAPPHREPMSHEEKELGHHHQRLMEERMESAFDLANALRPVEQVEERHRDTRSERW